MAKPFYRRFTKKVFIFSNTVVAILFLLGASVKYFNPYHLWFFGLLTLSLPYLILALVFFFIFWIVAMRVWMLISVIALAIGWNSVKNVFPMNFSGAFKMEKLPGSIRIMSWNVEHFDILHHKTHPEVKQKMLALINEYQPDIACFQEMVAGEDKKAINNISAFQQTLGFPEYYYSFEHRFDFDAYHHFGIMIFSKFPIIERTTKGYPPYDYNSVFQYVDLKINNDTVRLFNIHLQSLRFTQSNLNYLDNPGIGSDSDMVQSKSVITKLKRGFLKRAVQAESIKNEMNKSPYPIIVCGDFNDVPASYAYETIGKDMQNAFVKKGTGIGRTFSAISPTLRIDNIFVDNHFTIEQYTRISQRLSDHFPVIADFIQNH